ATVVFAEQHAVGWRKADIDAIAFAEDFRLDDRIRLQPETLRLDGIDGAAAQIGGGGDLSFEPVGARRRLSDLEALGSDDDRDLVSLPGRGGSLSLDGGPIAERDLRLAIAHGGNGAGDEVGLAEEARHESGSGRAVNLLR